MAKSKDKQDPEKVAKVKVEIETSGEGSAEISEKPAENGTPDATPKTDTPPKTPEENLAAEKDKYLRLAAEYDNFRKRNAKERDMIYGNAQADVVGKLLPVYDSLERALKLKCTDEAYYKGIELTMQQLMEILKDIGVLPIPAAGEKFDPNIHHAVVRVEDPNLGEGIIAEECRKGFTLGERIIRFSEVVVAN